MGRTEMQYHVVSCRELPPTLRINGLPCKLSVLNSSRVEKPFRIEVYDIIYTNYGSRPPAEALYEYGPWLATTAPFFVEVEKPIFTRWTGKEDENGFGSKEPPDILPKEIEIDNRRFTRTFDRYYFGADLIEDEICFIFDYMAPMYDADINYGMNLDVNIRLLESITKIMARESLKVIDYGVGTGICADANQDGNFNGWKIVGLDISSQMIKQARDKKFSPARPSSILENAYEVRAGKSHLPEKSFDGAIACFAVQYFLDLQPYREIHRLLKDGAPFVCNVLGNEIHHVEGHARNAGLVPQMKRRQQLKYEVRRQPVFLLAFIKQ